MKKNVSTVLMSATLATVIGLGGVAIANPALAFAVGPEDVPTVDELMDPVKLELERLSRENPDVSVQISLYYNKFGKVPDINSAEFKQFVIDSYGGKTSILTPTDENAPDKPHKKHDGPVIFIDETPEERAREDKKHAEETAIYDGLTAKEALYVSEALKEAARLGETPDPEALREAARLRVARESAPPIPDINLEGPIEKIDPDVDIAPKPAVPDAEAIAPKKEADVETKDEAVVTEDKKDADQAEAEVVAPEKETETPKVEDAEKSAVVSETDTEVKTEEKKETSNKSTVKDQTVGSDTEVKAAEGKQKQEAKHMKKSATPNTADVTAGAAAYLLSGLGFGLVSRKKR